MAKPQLEDGYTAIANEILEKLKQTVDHRHREWRPDTKTWWIDEVYEPELDQLFGNWYALAKMQGSLL